MRYGTVIEFFPDKGFGFIRPDLGSDVFFHITALGACEAEPEIKSGQPVKFELEWEQEKPSRKRAALAEDSASAPQRSSRRKAKFVELIDKIPGASLEEDAGPQPAARHPRARKKKPTWRR